MGLSIPRSTRSLARTSISVGRSARAAGRRLIRPFAPVAMVVALVLAFFATGGPSPAYAADRNHMEIVNSGTGLRADVMWASTSALTGVFLWPDNTSASQEFDLLDSGNGFFRIKARHSGQCLMLDWRSGFYDNGTPILQYPFCDAGYAPSEWSAQQIQIPCGTMCFPVDHTLLKNRATGRCLDAAAPSGLPAEQAVLQQWDCISSSSVWNARNQMWDINSLDPIIIH